MQFPVTRYQLLSTIESCGFRPNESARIVSDLEGEGRIELSGSMLKITNPTDPDASVLIGVCAKARGGTVGSVSDGRIREYLAGILSRATTHGSSRRN